MEFLKSGAKSVREAISHGSFSKIGDALANLVFSISQAKKEHVNHNHLDFKGSPKVPAIVLKNALNSAKKETRFSIQVKGDAHAIADAAEAILAFAWANGMISIDECVEVLSSELLKCNSVKLRDLREAQSRGFAKVYIKIFGILKEKL
ncbi:MAG: ribonuclease III family protein [Promethearchaeota archaeon]